ncbi:beta-glucosidase [Mumia flava]|uniref:Beta-glucosidase n=1 Tax=Mumia flava TaxID=1348852 RepID=A0A0B2B5V1_9ACTN|nr:glycoside hydrolase family 3 C-terminal domain-containing protein [Mumia flava]PJJ54368.1 beta-glucosidase [Mumia flava]
MTDPGDLDPASAAMPHDDAVLLISGSDLSSTRPLRDRQVPALVLSDGPHGLAMNLPDWAGKVPATCFPAPTALAATWDADLVQRVARAIGAEARAAGAHVLLGPSINVKRSPLGGRGFEYYAEDPMLAGRVGEAFVRGVQSAGVAACVKHFAVNSQETDRMRVSAEVSPRALREIYLAAFEHIVRTANPALLMASYNRVNGEYAAQNRLLLTTILRGEWGFDGAVISDWGAVDDPVAAVAAGLDLEMPGPAEGSRAAVRAALDTGDLDADDVLRAAGRVARAARTWATTKIEPTGVDHAAHHALAREVAAGSFALLRNDGTLPLAPDGGRVLVVGALARSPRIQGGGSSAVEPICVDDWIGALGEASTREVTFEPGYSVDGPTVVEQDELRRGAVALAEAADDVVVVVGPDTESEGFDRSTIELPADQLTLVRALRSANPRTVVVLNNGGAIEVGGWHEDVAAILDCWLPGQAGGAALADVLFGHVNPSGKLTETMPLTVRDTPTYLGFPGTGGHAFHGEGVFVGYRGYDAAERPVGFPFGHGLSYTTFAYSDAQADLLDGGGVDVAFTIRNSGDRDGAEVWQIYIEPAPGPVAKPPRTLATFGKVRLAAGEERRIEALVDRRAFARWDEREEGWVVDEGTYGIAVGSSSRDLRIGADVFVPGSGPSRRLDERSTLREWLADARRRRALLDEVTAADPTGTSAAFLESETILTMIGDMPVKRLFGDPAIALNADVLDRVRTLDD